MKNSYSKLNKKGRFLFWWFVYCGVSFTIMLIVISLLVSTVFKQKQLEQQQSTITKLKKENDSNTASILLLVAYLENVGG
jgi:uncharacterized membrane protein